MAGRNRKKKSMAKKIFLVEDHPTFREGLAQILEKERDLSICGWADTAAKALTGITRLKPDLALVDITLPGRSGLELIKEIRKTGLDVKLLVLSMHDQALYANRVLLAGGDGYIMKQEDPSEIVHAIRDVLSGHIYVSEDIFASSSKAAKTGATTAARRAFDQLGDLDLEILALMGRGKSPSEIARHLHIAVRQINSHFDDIRRKLNLRSPTALIRYAVCWVETGAT
jgi:DNA-binding NarL/FixJ family response regulator